MNKIRVFIRQHVNDIESFKLAYSNFTEIQKSLGVFFESKFISINKPNDIIVIHDFHSLKDAEAFISCESLKQNMLQAGVVGIPDIWITTEDIG